MRPKDVALSFVKAFCEGRVDDIEPLLGSDFMLEGPLAGFSDPASYMQSLRSDPPLAGSCSIRSCLDHGSAVSVLYEYTSPNGPLLVSQLFIVGPSGISRTVLDFDPSGVG